MHSCQNNPEKSYTEKKNEIRLLATRCLQVLHLMQQKTNLICKHLREHTMKIIDYEEKKMIPLTDEKISHMQSKKFVAYVKKNLVLMIMMIMIKSITK